MRAYALRALALCVVATGLWIPTSGTARADSCANNQFNCVTVPAPGAGSTGSPAAGGGNSGGLAACHDAGGALTPAGPVPCQDSQGDQWNGSCYLMAAPQPPATSPLWQQYGGPTASPSAGTLWLCSNPFQAWDKYVYYPNGRATVNPGQAAQTLTARAPWATANANTAPPPTFHTYVHYMNWLWVDQDQWKDVTVTLTVGGATVTLTGTPKYTTWTMGNGDTQICYAPGDVWTTGTPNAAQSDCQYAYNTMTNPYGDRWTIRAQITYGLAWSCTGACGGQMAGTLPDITANAGRPASITVYQRRAVITG